MMQHTSINYTPINSEIVQDTLSYVTRNRLPTISLSQVTGDDSITTSGSITLTVTVEEVSICKKAQELAYQGYKPLILNMANSTRPGGSFIDGRGTQEETICAQSNLYSGLLAAKKQKLFPIAEKGGILLKDVSFFKDDDYSYLQKPVQVDVFSSAAYDCNTTHKPNPERNLVGYDHPQKDADYAAGMRAKIRACFRAAVLNKNDALVLGAFGCGAFRNDPETISKWYKEVLSEEEFQGKFKVATFAIILSKTNLEAFKKCFFNSN